MEHHEQDRFEQLYAQHLLALKLQGKRSKTIDGYARAVRRIAGFFNCCPDNLTAADLKSYFAWMVENYSWSSVKVDLWGLSFFYRHVLAQPMTWVDIIKPPNSRTLPDIPTRQEVQLLINSVYRLRYRVYFFALYSMGLRLGAPLRRSELNPSDRIINPHRLSVRVARPNRPAMALAEAPRLRPSCSSSINVARCSAAIKAPRPAERSC